MRQIQTGIGGAVSVSCSSIYLQSSVRGSEFSFFISNIRNLCFSAFSSTFNGPSNLFHTYFYVHVVDMYYSSTF